jgi:hypothetical protein
VLSRDITPLLQGSVYAGFTDHHSTGFVTYGGEQAQIINAGMNLNYNLSQSLHAFVADTFIDRISSNSSIAATTNQLVIGLRKEF